MGTDHRFDRNELRAGLAALSPRLRTAFALLCARRLAPALARTAVVPKPFAEYYDRLWRHLTQTPESSADLAATALQIEALLPEDEGESPYAEDAIAALAYAYRSAVSVDTADAAWAAERVYNALDTFVQEVDHVDSSAPGGEVAIHRHPLIQAELGRQAADVRDLRDVRAPTTLALLRERADRAAASLFG